MNLFRRPGRPLLVVASLAVAVAVVACGGGTTGDTTADSGNGPNINTPNIGTTANNPPVEPTTVPERPAPPGPGGISVPLVGLPVGGGTSPEGEARQCVTADWLGSAIPAGMSVEVRAVQFDTQGVFSVDHSVSGCDGRRDCYKFVYDANSSNAQGCSVAVVTTGTRGASTGVTLAGAALCPRAPKKECDSFRQTIKGQRLVTLVQPTTSPPSASDTSSPTSTGDNSLPTATS